MPRTHNASKDGPPPKKSKKTPKTPTTPTVDPEEMAEAMKALEEKRSAEKAKAERAEKKASAKKKSPPRKTPPQPEVSADDAWKDLDDSDGEIQPMNLMGTIAEDAAAIFTDDAGGQVVKDTFTTTPGLGNLSDGMMTRAKKAASLSGVTGETEDSDYEPEVPSNEERLAMVEKKSAEKEKTEIQKVAQLANAENSKMNAKIKKYHDAIERNGKKNKLFQEAHMKFKQIGKDKNSEEILEFRKTFLKLIGDNKDKFAEIEWDTGETKQVRIAVDSPHHSGKKVIDRVHKAKNPDAPPKYKREVEYTTQPIITNVLHELAEFLRTTATYLDTKDIEAETIKEEIMEHKRKYEAYCEKKKELEDAKFNEALGL